MKSIKFFLIIILFRNLSFGQIYIERSLEPISNTGYFSMVSDSIGNLYVIGITGFGFSSPGWLTKVDSNHHILFNKPLVYSDITGLYDLVISKDENILMCGRVSGCDWIPSEVGIVLKYSTSGAEIWLKPLNPDTAVSSADNILSRIIELPNKDIAVSADSTLYYLNETGDSIWSQVFSERINSLENYGEYILIASDSDLHVIDTLGNTVNIVSYQGLVSINRVEGFKYLMSYGNQHYFVDSSFVPVDSFSYNNLHFNYGLLATDNDKICYGNSDGSEFACFDHSFNLIDSFHIQSANVSCSRMLLKDTVIYIVGSETAYRSYQYVKSFSIHGDYEYHDDDLELVDISFDTSYAYHPVNLPANVHALKFVPRVIVRNNGSNTIQSFNVNAESILPAICGTYSAIFRISNANLLPGTSMDFVLDTLQEYGIVLNPPYNYSYDFCAWLSCPDSSTDKNHSNDFLCDSFLIDGIVLIDELSENTFNIYPNPVGERLHIDAPDGAMNGDFSILNSLGKIVETGKISDGEISTFRLKQGFYFLKIDKSGGGSYINRFIKAESQ